MKRILNLRPQKKQGTIRKQNNIIEDIKLQRKRPNEQVSLKNIIYKKESELGSGLKTIKQNVYSVSTKNGKDS